MKKTRLLLNPLAVAVAIALPISVPTFAAPQLEEVIVTAQKREQSLQDVPIAVSAFSAQDLANSGAATLNELEKSSPNTTLQVSRGSSSTLSAFIRGVGQQDPLWGFEPGVGIYVDDVYYARPQGAVLDVFDVERIEILRGPQGTLYGKNTIGGAIKYVSRRMTGDFEGYIKTAIGSFHQQDINIGAQVPIIEDVLYVGGAIASFNRDGYGTFLNGTGNGRENFNKEVITGRISVEYSPTDSLFIRLAYDTTQDDSNAVGGFDLTAQTGHKFDSFAVANNADQEVESSGGSLTVDWELSDSISIKSITAVRDGTTDSPIDFDVYDSADLDVYAIYADEQFSQEFQVNWSADNFAFVGGIYYFDGEASGAFNAPFAGGAATLVTNGNVETVSKSLYADLTYDFTDSISAYVGGRYTSDKKTAEIFNGTAGAGEGCLVLGNCPLVVGGINTTRINSSNGIIDSNGDALVVQGDLNETYNEFSPRIGINFKISDSAMVYAGYSEGFKSGGFDMRANERINPGIVDGYNPETVDSFELGTKTELFENRIRLNAALFYMDYTDIQTIVPQTGDLCDNSTIQNGAGCTGNPDGQADTSANAVLNIGDATIQGVEIESIVQITESVSINFAVGYIDTEINEYLISDPTGGINDKIDVADQRDIQNTPEWNGQLKLAYDNDIEGFGYLHASISASFRDEKQIFEQPSVLDADQYTLLDASVAWESESEHWNVALHAKNITNETYRVSGYTFPATATGVFGLNGIATAYHGAPRTFTLSAGYKF